MELLGSGSNQAGCVGERIRPFSFHNMNRAVFLMTGYLVFLTGAGRVEAAPPEPDAIVATDGSGKYKTVQEAINAVPQTASSEKQWVILIKPGTYKELIYVQREKRFVRLVGEDPATTILTYDLHA